MSHAILNPSSAHRWLNCLGSVPLTLGVIDDGSEYADEGTAAHTLGALALSEGKPCSFYHGRKIDVIDDNGKVRRSYTVNEEFELNVQAYVDTVNDTVSADATLLVEQRVSSGIESMLYGPVDGTADAIVIMPAFKMIDVNDLKYGKGERVEAPENAQLRLYGLGALRMALDLGLIPADEMGWKVRMRIHQPRLDHISEETLTAIELLDWGQYVRSVVAKIDNGATELEPGDKSCRWCPRKATCSALKNYTMRQVQEAFPVIEDLTEWGIGKALEHVELVEQWVKAVRSTAWSLIDNGVKVPGWKLGEGRKGNREWQDETVVEGILRDRYRMTRDEMYNHDLKSPTQLEKTLGKSNPKRWEDLQANIVRKPATKTLMRDTDTRPAIENSVLDYFKDTPQ